MDDQGSQENPPSTNLPTPPPPPAEPVATEPVVPTEPVTPVEPVPPAAAGKAAEINKIDLSALAGFSFGTQWTPSGDRREGGSQGPQRGREGDGPQGEFRRDRRQARRPAGGPGESMPAPAGGAGAPAPRNDRPFQGDRFRRGEGAAVPRFDRGPSANFQRDDRGPRSEGGGPRFDRGPRGAAPVHDDRPYLSPYFEVTFYAEDTAFSALVKAVRASCHTYELFEIARVVLAKPERFVVALARKPDADGKRGSIYTTPVDGLPFENEDEAVQHVLRDHLDKFFTMTEVEIEPPKGSFQFVCRCGFTGELLGPPNYHRYQSILQQHHASRLAHMPFERFRERLETVKEPELVNQWLEKMKKTVRFVWKAEGVTEPLTFDSLEEARTYLLTHARDKVVRAHDNARFHGRGGELMPTGEIRAAIEGHLERQRRFPLDTANSLRGRLRREGFTIFKRGSKGVSYVCAVKRKFRLPGQVFSESITALIAFVEKYPLVPVKEIPGRYLGITAPEGTTAGSSAVAAAEGFAAPVAPPSEEEVRLKRLWMDLRWLVTEGYVTEYSDGKLFAPPPLTPQQQKSEEAANAAADAAEDVARGAAEEPSSTEPPPPEVPPTDTAPAPETAPIENLETAAPAVEPPAPEIQPGTDEPPPPPAAEPPPV